MENMEELNIRLSFSRKSALPLLAVFFLCWRPGFIGSESLTLTTYYPAPYGGYVSILTTGNTVLARDGGVAGSYVRIGPGYNNNNARRDASVKLEVGSGDISTDRSVRWGINRGTLSQDQGASIELGGTGTPYIDFSQNMGEDFSARLMLTQAGRLTVTSDLSVTRDLYVGRDLFIAAGGRLRGLCYTKSYVQGATTFCNNTANERVVTWYGSAAPTCGMLFRGGELQNAANWSQQVCVGEDKSGTMVCCRIEW